MLRFLNLWRLLPILLGFFLFLLTEKGILACLPGAVPTGYCFYDWWGHRDYSDEWRLSKDGQVLSAPIRYYYRGQDLLSTKNVSFDLATETVVVPGSDNSNTNNNNNNNNIGSASTGGKYLSITKTEWEPPISAKILLDTSAESGHYNLTTFWTNNTETPIPTLRMKFQGIVKFEVALNIPEGFQLAQEPSFFRGDNQKIYIRYVSRRKRQRPHLDPQQYEMAEDYDDDDDYSHYSFEYHPAQLLVANEDTGRIFFHQDWDLHTSHNGSDISDDFVIMEKRSDAWFCSYSPFTSSYRIIDKDDRIASIRSLPALGTLHRGSDNNNSKQWYVYELSEKFRKRNAMDAEESVDYYTISKVNAVTGKTVSLFNISVHDMENVINATIASDSPKLQETIKAQENQTGNDAEL